MTRIFWFLLGVVTTVVTAINGRKMLRRYTPEGVAERVEETGKQAVAQANKFYSTFKSAMRNREEELRKELNLDTPA